MGCCLDLQCVLVEGLVAPFEVSREGGWWFYCAELALQDLVCVGAADSTWGGVLTDFVEATPLALGS